VAAKSYRLLRAILNTAVDPDRIIARNPCKVPGADRETPAERPVISVAQVFDLAERMPARFKAMVLVTAFASLRFGEVTALRRSDIAGDASWLRVTRGFVEVPGRGLIEGPPKSRAGVRTVIVPSAIRPEIVRHMAEYVQPGGDALIFTGEKGGPIRRASFGQRVKWIEVAADLGVAGLHFHDLRHAGNIWASKAGMSTKDLMARMGHDDMRAALIYQRATSDADQRIADKLSEMVTEHEDAKTKKAQQGDDEDGAAGVPVPVG
jgi:integrase